MHVIKKELTREDVIREPKLGSSEWDRDREICEKATPGPWGNIEIDRDASGTWLVHTIPGSRGTTLSEVTINDDRFISAARTRWPAALDRIAELELKLSDLERENGELAKQHDRQHEWNAKLATRLAAAEAVCEAARTVFSSASMYLAEKTCGLNKEHKYLKLSFESWRKLREGHQ